MAVSPTENNRLELTCVKMAAWSACSTTAFSSRGTDHSTLRG